MGLCIYFEDYTWTETMGHLIFNTKSRSDSEDHLKTPKYATKI